ncbi:hypothetical protein, partial [Modestobacter sp. SYSU DS0902]
MIGWVAVAVILVGLPLAAWWVSRRPVWSRLRPSVVDDDGLGAEWRLRRDLARRHGLDQAELAEVEKAVSWGRELTDPRLRAAIVEWAEQQVELRATQPRWVDGRWLPVLLIAWGSGIAAYVVFAVAQGNWGDVNWFSGLGWLGWGLLGWRMRGGPRRALQRNSGPP